MDFALAHALSQAAVFHDLPTAAHNWRVTMYAQAFAEVLEMSESETNRFMMAALLHDLGKIDVPHSILVKTEPLTTAEFECMKQHSEHGFNRLRRMGERDEIILSVVRWHHERLDGTGYPDRLIDEEIPPAARYFAVIDAFDAMTSIRSYRPGAAMKSAENALEELARDAGKSVCPDAVAILLQLHAEGRLDPIRSHLNDKQALSDLQVVPAADACIRARGLLQESTPPGMPDVSHLLNLKAG